MARISAIAKQSCGFCFGIPAIVVSASPDCVLLRVTCLPIPFVRSPYISVAAEMSRGFAELGAAWIEIGNAAGQQRVVSEGEAMLSEGEAVRRDLLVSLQRSKIPSVGGANNGVTCRPHVAGWTCEGRHSHPRNETNYTYPTLDVFCTGRTYPEAFYSGMLPADAVKDIMDWASKNDGVFTVP
eukprot:COSAG01_NODE_4209_length_5240_cov_1.801595_6_plen_183_part_00